MRNTTLLLVLLVALASACQQNPDHLPSGEDEPQQRHSGGYGEYVNPPKVAGMLPERTEDIRNQNIMVELRYVQADEVRNEIMAIGVRSVSKDGSTGVRVTDSDLFRSNGLNLTVMGPRYVVPFFTTKRHTRGNTMVGNFLSVRNRGRGQIGMINDRPNPVLVRTPGGGTVVADGRALTGSQLIVEPEIIDTERELIRVKVWPQLAGMNRDGSIDTTRIQSEAVLENGGALVIGGDTSITNGLGKEWFAKDHGGVTRQMLIIARVRY